jgi:hypothetical protein
MSRRTNRQIAVGPQRRPQLAVPEGMLTSPMPETHGLLAWSKGERRAILAAAALVAAIVVLWTSGSTSRQVSEDCRSCLSTRTTRQWGIGTTDGTSFLAADTEVSLHITDFHRLLPASHSHDWYRTSLGTTCLGLREYRACSMPRPHALPRLAERRRPFYLLLEGPLREGALTKSDLEAMATVPDEPSGEWLADPSRRALIARTRGLLLLEDDPDAWQHRAFGR